MAKVRVLLVDDNPALTGALSEALSEKADVEVAGVAHDGAEALDMVRRLEPDVMVLDIVMPRMDGFSTLAELNRPGFRHRPRVIVLTGLTRDDLISRAMHLGADYYMIKPADTQTLYTRILDVAAMNTAINDMGGQASLPRTGSTDECVTNLFLSIGIPAHIKGYTYLREAVMMVMEDHDLINRITKELYPGIAHRFSSTPSKVERAMRHAIGVAWNRGRLDSVNRLYGYNVFSADDRPTNGEFIALVCDKVRLERCKVS